jgi:LmbE family N-acetylglucosaminyl deacetylase
MYKKSDKQLTLGIFEGVRFMQAFGTINSVLVLAPHTDDGELGCGGTISRLVESGKRVFYVAFSAAEESVRPEFPRDILRQEVKKATSALGIDSDDLIVLEYQVRRFPEFRQEILDDLIKLKKKINPDLVLLPSLHDTHQDHATIANEGYRAFKNVSMLGYEMPWNNPTFDTDCFVKLSEDNVLKKISALNCYDSQKHRTYATENFVRGLMSTRGAQVGTQFAEAFEVMKWVIN